MHCEFDHKDGGVCGLRLQKDGTCPDTKGHVDNFDLIDWDFGAVLDEVAARHGFTSLR